MSKEVKIIDLEEHSESKQVINTPPKKKRVAAYARVSTGSVEQATSFENQVQEWTERINKNPDWEFVKVYSDEGKSGTSTKKRLGFQEMIEDAHAGKIDLILVKSISRLARNNLVAINTVRELKAINVEVWFDKENLSSFDSKSDFLFSILASISQEESRNTSENITWTYRRKMEKGIPCINTPRFLGYDKDETGTKLVINEAEADTVRLIFNLYDSGMGCLKIANELEQRGIKTVTGSSKWWTSTVTGILKNEKYVGDLLQQKKITVDYLTHKRVKNKKHLYFIKNAHEPIVSRDLWNRVQAKIKSNFANVMGVDFDRTKYNNKYPLSGALVCLNCGATYKRRTWNSKHKTAKRHVYQCTNYVIKDENGLSCHSKAIGEQVSHDICCDIINNLFLGKSRIFSKINTLIKSSLSSSGITAEEKRITKIKDDLNKKIDELMAERIRLTSPELKSKIDKQYRQLIDQFERVDNQLINLNARQTASLNVKNRLQKMHEILGANKLTSEMLTRQIVDLFFYQIFVNDTGELIFVIDSTHTLKHDELIQNRKNIANYEPIYTGEMIDKYSRFKNLVKYKVVLV